MDHRDLYSAGFNFFGNFTNVSLLVNCLPNDKILERSKLKAFANVKILCYLELKFVLGRTENILGKGENAGYQYFLLFPRCFQTAPSSVSLKVGIVS